MGDDKPGTAELPASGLQLGEEAPDFRLPSTQGNEVSLSQYRGLKYVFLVFLKGMT